MRRPPDGRVQLSRKERHLRRSPPGGSHLCETRRGAVLGLARALVGSRPQFVDTGITVITFRPSAGPASRPTKNITTAMARSRRSPRSSRPPFSSRSPLSSSSRHPAALKETSRSTPTLLAFAVLIVSLVVDVSRGHHSVAHRPGDEERGARRRSVNFVSDIIGSSIALLGLIAARFGFMQGDAFAAFAVAIYIAMPAFAWRAHDR